MKKKIIAFMDTASGNITDNNGSMLGTFPSYDFDDYQEALEVQSTDGQLSEEALLGLAGLGFSADDILKLTLTRGRT